MKSLTRYKKVIKWVFWITISLIVFLTFQAIYETEDWKFFDVDFNSRDHIISAYGSLIGGILAFLSILFVLYQVYEQREQIMVEKQDAAKDKLQDLKDRLLLLTNYLKTLEKDILRHGERMESFFKAEKEYPSKMNTMYFNTNKNFERVIEMDILSNFKAFQAFFKEDEEDWQKQFVNLYEISDFYNEAFKDLKKKYTFHIEDKVAKQKQIAADMMELLNANSRLVDDYRIKYGVEDYLTKPWSNLINQYTPTHYAYLQEVQDAGEVPDFRYISDKLLFPFIRAAMDIRRDSGYDDLGSRNIIELASTIRKKIWEVEIYSVQYAEDIEKQFNNYFIQDNQMITQLNGIKSKIQDKI
ncbi:hypothetical protein [Winogradskyella alexanderae]|uniref:Phage abortive infection protein n=1 Tax=Winogradskyella alexanderae TaxID=2877123 RepID=A0ABS7XP29_9FLAO|nr:hypothetical protein [Winogradskyella alexanderae]MCA0131755.1 hypothetical protein [Winogradskyella alexanderae]